jgi:CMP-N,N'-diacetyllegionaminic acid synthase
MVESKRILAVVPARGGSKGVPLKNIRPVAGIPLIAHTARTISECPFIDRAVVSTDGEAIARIAEESGLAAPFRRPESLSGDRIADWDVLVHALVEMERIDACVYDVVMMLQPTSPLRKPSQLIKVLETLILERYDSVWTVSETDVKFHPLKQLVITDGRLDYFDPRGRDIIARQQLGKAYHRNGLAYAMTRACLLNEKKIMGAKAGAVIISDPVVNIDTLEDFRTLENILSSQAR